MKLSAIVARFVVVLAIAAVGGVVAHAAPPSLPIKVGIIGLDAHAVPWTTIINNPLAKPPVSDMKIVAAYPSYSKDIPFSNDNIQKNIKAMRGLGV